MTKVERAELSFTRCAVLFLLFVVASKPHLTKWEYVVSVVSALFAAIYALRAIYFTVRGERA